MSGDSEGRCFFWEWSHPFKIVRTIKVRARARPLPSGPQRAARAAARPARPCSELPRVTHPRTPATPRQAHDGVCIGCMWHPQEPSKVITCGWDGAIKMWD